MFEAYIGVAAWFVCALFAFWLATRARPGRELVGRILVGIGALVVGFIMVLPDEGPSALPENVSGILIIVAGIALLVGLALSYPRGGLRSVAETSADFDDEEEDEDPVVVADTDSDADSDLDSDGDD